MAQFNFLSGSSIDNFSSFVFDAISSGESYLGFARGQAEVQWGVNALVYIEHLTTAPTSGNWSSDVIGKTSEDVNLPVSASKFFDMNVQNAGIISENDNRRAINIGSLPVTAGTNYQNIENITAAGTSLSMVYLGEHFAIINGLDKYYYNTLSGSADDFYITNYNNNKYKPIKILKKSFVNVPFYTTSCNLYSRATSAAAPVLVASDLQRTINILGESYVTGMIAPELITAGLFSEDSSVATANKYSITHMHSFVLKDTSGNILMDSMTYVDSQSGSQGKIFSEISGTTSQKYVVFRYPFLNNDYQYIKFIVGSKQNNDLAIWNEELPYNAAIPVADANPPALDVSYLKNPVVAKSIFDVKGLVQILPSEVLFVKELNSTTEEIEYSGYGFDIPDPIELSSPNTTHSGVVRSAASVNQGTIRLKDFHTFVVGDVIQIPINLNDPSGDKSVHTVIAADYTYGASLITVVPVLSVTLPLNYSLQSGASNVAAVIKLATTSDKVKALKYGFTQLLISKNVPLQGDYSPTEDIYRQLFICHKPVLGNGNPCSTTVNATPNIVLGPDFFGINKFEYNIGTLLYLSNKIPVYRKWANIDEQFKIIL